MLAARSLSCMGGLPVMAFPCLDLWRLQGLSNSLLGVSIFGFSFSKWKCKVLMAEGCCTGPSNKNKKYGTHSSNLLEGIL